MNRPTAAQLLTALRQGLRSRDWPQVAASRGSLRVRIHKLRSKGFQITAEPHGAPHPRNGRPEVVYRLEGPCQACGRPL